ncbi:MAG TPA: phosphatase PAP2 family protein [Hanamia sp.]|nr:phosphatase PAP2 family protein [Hanamia sp.]
MHEFYFSFINFLIFLLSHFFKVLYQIDLHLLEFINHERIKPLDSFFIFITNTSFIISFGIPVFLLIYALITHWDRLKRQSRLILISLGINTVVIEIIKQVVNRQRPYKVDSFIEKLSGGGSPSFPSGHTADAFLIATALSILFSKQKVWLVLVWIWAFMVTYSRVVLGVHYPSDVFASMIISSSLAVIITRFFIKRNFLKDATIS